MTRAKHRKRKLRRHQELLQLLEQQALGWIEDKCTIAEAHACVTGYGRYRLFKYTIDQQYAIIEDRRHGDRLFALRVSDGKLFSVENLS